MTTAFAGAGWNVDVVHRVDADQRGGSGYVTVDNASTAVRYIGIPGAGLGDDTPPVLRPLMTAWYAATAGDRSGRWAHRALAMLANDGPVHRPDVIVAFFTPRGPLTVARRAHELWNVPWIADLQDPITEGARAWLRPIVRGWMRRTLRSAAHVIQISPELATESSRALRRPVFGLRHAVPTRPVSPARVPTSRGTSDFILLYSGGINTRYQDPRPLLEAISTVNREAANCGTRRIRLRFACTPEIRGRVERHASPALLEAVEWKGWLDRQLLDREASSADALVLIPWSESGRKVVPSKLFEYLSYSRPILIAGRDSGAVRAYLAELGHRDVVAASSEKLSDILRAALRGRTDGLFAAEGCTIRPFSEEELGRRYVHLVEKLTVSSPLASPQSV